MPMKLYKLDGENLESYNRLLKRMFVDDKIELLDQAIVDKCGVKIRNIEKVVPTLEAICQGFHDDQVNLRM